MHCFDKDQLSNKLNLSQYGFPTLLPGIKLPVMDALLNNALTKGKQDVLSKTAIYYVHHPLQTSINVIDSIIQLGAKPSNIFILGKRYSECEAVVSSLIQWGVYYQPCSMQTSIGNYASSFIRDINWLWAKLIEQISDDIEEILVLDHGGHAITYLPLMLLEHYKIIGIEKTTAGFIDSDKRGLPPIPMIDVANSAAKKFLESPLIAEAVVSKIMSYLPENKEDFIFGVVGLGAIGQSVINRLRSLGCRLIAYDKNVQQLQSFQSTKGIHCTYDLAALIASCDYIFGCSGRDISEGRLEQFRLSSKNKTLISCSSEDKEFLSLLQMVNQKSSNLFDPLDDIEYKTEFGATIHLLRGGFPVNFDASGESVPAKDIQLTRSLVLAAVMQASSYFQDTSIESGVYALDPSAQKFIIKEWLKYQDESSFHSDDLNNFLNEEWLANYSNGLLAYRDNLSFNFSE